MRLLANEKISRVLVKTLRQAGHDVLWARTDAPGESDRAHLREHNTSHELS